MLIEQSNGKHIDTDDIVEMFYDKTSEEKYVVVAVLKGYKTNYSANNLDILETIYLNNIFDSREQAKCWIKEIKDIKEFYQSLKRYKV